MQSKVGIATSLFKDTNFDPFATVDFAVAHDIPWVQLYLDANLEGDLAQIDQIREKCVASKINILCHSPRFLNSEILDGHHIAAINRLFPKGIRQYAVVHYDERADQKDALKAIHKLNASGISVCLENYYISHSRDALIRNINGYSALIHKAAIEKMDVIPTLDFPRLFIEPFSANYNSLFLTELLLQDISLSVNEVMLHLVDFNNPQQRREDWVILGEGIMPYNAIFEALDRYGLRISAAILEFEDMAAGFQSIAPLSKFLKES